MAVSSKQLRALNQIMHFIAAVVCVQVVNQRRYQLPNEASSMQTEVAGIEYAERVISLKKAGPHCANRAFG